MAQTELHPDWVVGISIGAINAAIFAGNAPEKRVDRLREFWEEITAPAMGFDTDFAGLFGRGEASRALANQMSALTAVTAGSPPFFRPRIPNPWFHPPGTIEATSYYDTRPLRATLERATEAAYSRRGRRCPWLKDPVFPMQAVRAENAMSALPPETDIKCVTNTRDRPASA